MPGRGIILVNDYYYHIYNRGSDKRNIFINAGDYRRFIQTFHYYQYLGPKIRFSRFIQQKSISFDPSPNQKLVEIICYCLMPNHFHFLVKQLKENGVSIFVSQLTNSYTRYFNTKYSRVGPLFQGTFKAVEVDSDEQLLHVSRYIHLNPIVSDLARDLDLYPWSSYSEYVHSKSEYCQTNEVLSFFKTTEDYKQFLKDNIDYGITLERLKHQLIDVEY